MLPKLFIKLVPQNDKVNKRYVYTLKEQAILQEYEAPMSKEQSFWDMTSV